MVALRNVRLGEVGHIDVRELAELSVDVSDLGREFAYVSDTQDLALLDGRINAKH